MESWDQFVKLALIVNGYVKSLGPVLMVIFFGNHCVDDEVENKHGAEHPNLDQEGYFTIEAAFE